MDGLVSSAVISRFRTRIRAYYKSQGRNLPWRFIDNPYYITVSEIMLQQTQVARVLPKYDAFCGRFPTVQALARAPLRDVLLVWQGLGYNRRAKALHTLARQVLKLHDGKIPQTEKALCALPGIGQATARAILAFAYNRPSVFIETNIRTVFIHFFFKGKNRVSDRDLIPCIEKTLDKRNPREWYYALMDYGVFLKQKFPGLQARSLHYVRQSPFRGSRREVRGLVLKNLSQRESVTVGELVRELKKSRSTLEEVLADLVREGFIMREKKRLKLRV